VAPALLVSGARDRVTRPAGADQLAGALPHARLLRLDGVGHFPHLEAPDRVLPAIAEHLA
jgi:pimeloyl-ACP methyl ester carboxylesterase